MNVERTAKSLGDSKGIAREPSRRGAAASGARRADFEAKLMLRVQSMCELGARPSVKEPLYSTSYVFA